VAPCEEDYEVRCELDYGEGFEQSFERDSGPGSGPGSGARLGTWIDMRYNVVEAGVPADAEMLAAGLEIVLCDYHCNHRSFIIDVDLNLRLI
jgi:hypothetical protein